jgi:hypothetical protein
MPMLLHVQVPLVGVKKDVCTSMCGFVSIMTVDVGNFEC